MNVFKDTSCIDIFCNYSHIDLDRNYADSGNFFNVSFDRQYIGEDIVAYNML